MIFILLDENVSLDLARQLRRKGYSVEAIIETSHRGSSDNAVWQFARKRQAVLITRDNDFTNPVSFIPTEIFAIIYIRRGNLSSNQEAELVVKFLDSHPFEEFKGKLVTLSPHQVTYR